MRQVRCDIVETRRQLDEVLRLRYEVFAEERKYLDPTQFRIPREVDGFDTLDTTIHFVARVDNVPVGTGRLILPSKEVAQAMGVHFGFDMESKFDLTPLASMTMRPAETMRYCVRQCAHKTNVAIALHAHAAQLSRALGITHWVACANTETDSTEDVRLIEHIAEHRGFIHSSVRLAARGSDSLPLASRHAFFDELERGLARANPQGARFPRLLSMFSSRMKARMIGQAHYDPRFRMYSVPILMTVAEQSETFGVHLSAPMAA